MQRASLNCFEAWRVFPLGLKTWINARLPIRGTYTAPLGIVETGFEKVAGESTRIVETGSKTREEKICGLHEWEGSFIVLLILADTS